jgi:hypothetical protein
MVSRRTITSIHEAPPMRLPHVRFTMRRMMVAVAIVGVATWIMVTATRLWFDPNRDTMYCVWQSPQTGEVDGLSHSAPVFWPRFLATLAGKEWPGDYRCPCGEGLVDSTGAVNPLVRRMFAESKQLIRSFHTTPEHDAFGARLRAERGLARRDKGDLDGAIADLDQAVRLSPRDAEAHHERGLVRRSRGDLAGAEADLREAKRLNPGKYGASKTTEPRSGP